MRGESESLHTQISNNLRNQKKAIVASKYEVLEVVCKIYGNCASTDLAKEDQYT
jgi:hypothetical protein